MWTKLTQALGLPSEPDLGDRVATTEPGAPPLAGTVAAAGDGMLTMVLDQPGRGIGLVGVGGPGGDEAYVTVRAQLFGTDAAEVAEREQRAWEGWLADRWT